MRYLKIDGTNLLTTYGLWIAGDKVYNGPDASVETVKVPGRNGDLVYSNRRYNNFTLSYPAALPANFKNNFSAIRAFLYQKIGYRKIEDSYFTDRFRMGRITGTLNPSDIFWNNDTGLFTLNFDCKPQHFLNSGLTATEYTSGATIANNTLYEALPLMRVYGTGSFTLNGVTVTIEANNYSYVDIDSEIQEAYYGSTNLNPFVTVTGDHFPTLSPGNNTLSLGTGITKVIITPRWWTL